MKLKLYGIFLLSVFYFSFAQAQIEPINNQRLAAELQLRTAGPPSIPLTCGVGYSDFGDVMVGEEETREFLIQNTGQHILFIHGASIEGSDEFSVSNNFDFPEEVYGIAPGSSISFSVTFAPTDAGPEEAYLYLYSSDEDEDPCIRLFKGEGYVPEPGTLRIRSTVSGIPYDCDAGLTFEFPDLLVGESDSRTYLVENIGDEPLLFYGITLSGSPDFTIDYEVPPVIPYAIAAGESIPYTITFTPSSPGEKDAEHVITTSDMGKEPCSIELEGGGLDKKSPFLYMMTPNGDQLECGDTYYIDLSDTYPGPVGYGFYFTFRNYGTEDLVVSGTVSIAGQTGSGFPIEPFSVDPLEFIFLNTTVYLPGNQVTTLVYILNTNDPDQPFCTIYVEINQLPYKTNRKTPAGSASIQEVSWNQSGKTGLANAKSAILPPSTIQQGSDADVRLYPTISRDIIHLEFSDHKQKRYQIMNASGKVVASGQTEATPLDAVDIAGLSPGLYWIRIEGHARAKKFVKIR